MNSERWVSIIAVALFFQVAGQSANANGYRILGVKSARATAMGETGIAQGTDPSAQALNPATLAGLPGHQVNLQATLCGSEIERTAADGSTHKNEDTWQTVPSVFYSGALRDGLAMGLGVTVPNGLSSEWSDRSFARYVATYSDLFVTEIAPAVGWQMTDDLRLGAAACFYYSDATLRRMVDGGLALGKPGAMDAESELEGDGTAWGARLGATYAVTERQRVGLSYQHPFSIDYDGTLRSPLGTSTIEAGIDFPLVLSAGYACTPAARWTLEMDVDWTHWDDTGDITVDFTDPLPLPDQVLAQDLADAFSGKFGAEYRSSERWAWRGGYIYNENATPTATWRPSLPDTDTHFVTAGAGYTRNQLTVDGALQFVYYATRTIDNNVDFNEFVSSSSIDGTYRTWAPCASLAATYRF